MKKTRKSVLILLALTLSIFPLGLFGTVFAKTPFVIPDYEPVDWQSGLAGALAKPDPSSGVMPEYTGLDYYGPGDIGAFGFDWDIGGWVTLRAVTEFVEIWVADDLSFPDGDTRNDDMHNLAITEEMVQYLADEFSDVIYGTLTPYFGTPADRDGTGTIFEALGWNPLYYNWVNTTNPQRVILKIFNILDDNYYDPTYPSYVAGYFSSLYTGDYYNRNMINIDAWRWWQRLGPEGHQWFLDEDPELEVTRPNLYESVTAHEFQHNIHSDRLPGDNTYMNEACSLFSEPLCGYELDTGQIEWFLATPDNSLTEWGDQGGINILADYGAAFLWALYLNDHYGTNFMGDYVKNGNAGTDGINALLAPYLVTYNDVFRDWTIANLIHTDEIGGGIYNYDSVDLGVLGDVSTYEISKTKFGWKKGKNFGTTFTIGTTSVPKGYDTGVIKLSSFGTDYIKLTGIKGENYIFFDGDDRADYDYKWKYLDDDDTWYSGAADMLNILIAGKAYVNPADPTLELTTYWDIEDFWDFGFVQISTDDGETWTSLENDYTTLDYDPNSLHNIIDNLPGLTSWSVFVDPDGVVTMTFDLSAYLGEDVLIGFRYMTDWGTTYEGWYIYDVSVSGETVLLKNVHKEADFMVTAVKIGDSYEITEFPLSDIDETGVFFDDIAEDEDIILIVSPIMKYGTTDYRFRNMLPEML